MNNDRSQTEVLKQDLDLSSDWSSYQEKGDQVPILCDELVEKLEDVDKLLRKEIRREVNSNNGNGSASSRLACLIRCRADVQSAITSLLGAGH